MRQSKREACMLSLVQFLHNFTCMPTLEELKNAINYKSSIICEFFPTVKLCSFNVQYVCSSFITDV